MLKVGPAVLTLMGSLPFIDAGFGLLFIRLSDRLTSLLPPASEHAVPPSSLQPGPPAVRLSRWYPAKIHWAYQLPASPSTSPFFSTHRLIPGTLSGRKRSASPGVDQITRAVELWTARRLMQFALPDGSDTSPQRLAQVYSSFWQLNLSAFPGASPETSFLSHIRPLVVLPSPRLCTTAIFSSRFPTSQTPDRVGWRASTVYRTVGPSIRYPHCCQRSLKTKRLPAGNNQRQRSQSAPPRRLIHHWQPLLPGHSHTCHSNLRISCEAVRRPTKYGVIRIFPASGAAIPHRNCACPSPDRPAIETDELEGRWGDCTARTARACALRGSGTQ